MQVVVTLTMVTYLFVIVGLVAINCFRRTLAIVNAENIELKTELASLEKELEYLQNKQKQSKAGGMDEAGIMGAYDPYIRKYVSLIISVPKEYDQSTREYLAHADDQAVNDLPKLINKALASYDTVTLCLLGNENQYREEMIRTIFKNINIVYNYNANFKDIFDKIDLNISVILTGSDNVKKYREATEQFANISVKEFYKNQNDANGDMVVNRIKNKEYFEKNTPFKIHNFYDRLLNFYAK